MVCSIIRRAMRCFAVYNGINFFGVKKVLAVIQHEWNRFLGNNQTAYNKFTQKYDSNRIFMLMEIKAFDLVYMKCVACTPINLIFITSIGYMIQTETGLLW